MNFPITGDTLYDFVLVVVTVIVGFGLALKADKSWGYVIAGLGIVWAFMLLRPWMGF